jgi:hypothetical protein
MTKRLTSNWNLPPELPHPTESVVMSEIIIFGVLVSILTNLLKVWEFVSSRLGSHIKKPLLWLAPA